MTGKQDEGLPEGKKEVEKGRESKNPAEAKVADAPVFE